MRQYFRSELVRSGLSQAELIRSFGAKVASHYFQRSQFMIPTAERYVQLREVMRAAAPDAEPPILDRSYEEISAEFEEALQIPDVPRRTFQARSGDSSDLWTFSSCREREDRHPAAKPVPLFWHILETSTRPGDLVLDTFAGAAPVGVACVNLGRRAILVEQDPHWHAVGVRRIEAAHALERREMIAVRGPLFE